MHLFAGKIERAYEALNIFDYFTAKELFEKVHDKEIVAAPFGLSIIYGRNDNPFYNLDSAYHYILKADTSYSKLSFKEIEDLNELGVDSMRIENWKDSIDFKVYKKVASQASVSKWQLYIQKHKDSPYLPEAIEERNHLAFSYAKDKNTADAYYYFLETYPESRQFYEAQNLFELRLYEEQTQKGRITDYQRFILDFPESPYLRQAQDSVYQIATKENSITSYKQFIEDFPNNPNTEQAWRNLYKLYMHEFSPERIVEFRIDYPNYPFVEDLMQDMKLSVKTFLPFMKKQKWGFMDTLGHVLINAEYDLVEPFQEGLALVVKNGKVGYINKSGDVVIPFMYDDGEAFKQGMATVMKNDMYGFIDKTNRIRLPFNYELLGAFSSGLAVVANDTAYGYVNKDGEIVIPITLSFASDFQNGYAVVEQSSKKGIINELGKTIVPMEFQWLENFNSFGVARAKKDSLLGLIDKNGSTILPFEYERIGEFNQGLALIMKNGKYGYVNTNGKIVIDLKFDFKTEALVWGNFKNGFVKYHQNGKFGIIDTSGEKIFPAIFQDVDKFQAQSYIAVKKRGKWGYSNENLNLVIPYIYDISKTFIDGLGLVSKDGMWGLIRHDQTWKLPNHYDQAERIGDSLYLLRQNNSFLLYHLSWSMPSSTYYDKVKPFNERFLGLFTKNEIKYFDRIKKKFITLS